MRFRVVAILCEMQIFSDCPSERGKPISDRDMTDRLSTLLPDILIASGQKQPLLLCEHRRRQPELFPGYTPSLISITVTQFLTPNVICIMLGVYKYVKSSDSLDGNSLFFLAQTHDE